jgi:phosphate transport system substrate-binding protein
MPPRLRCLLTVALSAVSAVVVAAGPPLVWRGDITTANGVVDGMAKAWQQAGHGKVTLQPFNTVSGIDAVIAGTADVAGSARRAAPGRSGEAALVFTPVAWDALVMVARAGNPASNLSLRQLHDIYYGKITNWKDVGGKDEPIHLYAVASPTDGVEFSLRRLLFGRGNQPVAAPRLYVNVMKLQEAIALDPKALGVSTLANVHGHPKLKMLSIDGTRPSVANVADGSYPLYTPLYLFTRKDGPNAAEVQQFVAFASSPKATSAMRSNLLLPYADASGLSGRDSQRLASIASEVGRTGRTLPVAAPGATYASRSATAPTSERTLAAREALQEKREADKVVATAKTAKANFRAVHGSAVSTARPGFGEVKAAATTVSDQAARGGSFGKVTGSAATAPAKADGKKTAGDDSASTYKVAPGDTLWSIAKQHAVSVTDMRTWNDLDGNAVRVGQTLRLQASR